MSKFRCQVYYFQRLLYFNTYINLKILENIQNIHVITTSNYITLAYFK